MYPSSNNSFNYINYNSPISPFSSLYHIPSPPMHYEDELLLLQALILEQQQSQPLEEESNNVETIADAFIENKNDDNGAQLLSRTNRNPNKRAPKKDRHSKITTAHGPRDRRMRLSLDVAREFFDLQDTLGFDKASKTVDWLLTKSRSAIREVAASLGLNNYDQPSPAGATANTASSAASECEAYCSAGIYGDDSKPKPPPSSSKEKNKKKAKPPRIRAAFAALTKESRKKARERARERTMMKKKLDAMAPNRFGSWSPFDGGEESGTNLENKAGVFSQQVPVMEEISSLMDTHVNKHLLGTYQQINGGIFSQDLEEPEVELLSSQFHIHVNKQLSPFRDFPAGNKSLFYFIFIRGQ